MKLVRETIHTDVLVIGGGLAGCMATLRAAEIVGAQNVLLVEKADVRRSGNAATGVDHTWSYMSSVHKPLGFTLDELVEDHVKATGTLQDRDIIYAIGSNIEARLRDMDRWGFPVRTGGKWNYVRKIHRVPTFLHWAGRDQKILFSKLIHEKGIRVLNRVMTTDLLRDGDSVAGAIGFGIRDPKFYEILAKSVVLATGTTARLFPGVSGWEFNRSTNPFLTGDGIAMAYRAGAELTGLEFLYLHTGPRNFHKKGRGSWIGITMDSSGKPIGTVRENVDRKKINISIESPSDMVGAYQSGRGPVLMDCSDTPQEDVDYMKWALSNEGNVTLLDYLEKKGIGLKDYKVEFCTYEPELKAGINIDLRAAASIPGLYAAGDVIGNIKRGVSPGAYAMGWIAGESAARDASCRYSRRNSVTASFQAFTRARYTLFNSFLQRKRGASWKEASAALQDTMGWYGGMVRYEALLRAGLLHMERLREEASNTISATNLHELMHCVSVLNLMDVGEASMLCARERKESRMTLRESFRRVDYLEENPEMSRMLILKTENNCPKFYWRDPRITY